MLFLEKRYIFIEILYQYPLYSKVYSIYHYSLNNQANKCNFFVFLKDLIMYTSPSNDTKVNPKNDIH